MSYTVSKLVTDSYYESGIVSRLFETVEGNQLTDGIGFLNETLADKTINNSMIQYYNNYNFFGVIGQEKYFIPDLILAETFVFFINSIRYHTTPVQRANYFGSSRANNINSLPWSYHIENCLGGANLYVYFSPDQNYPMEIWGQFRLGSVVLGQDLSLTLEQYYINYLKYELAARLCAEYRFNVPPGVAAQLKKYYAWIEKQSATTDFRMQKVSTLGKGAFINYAEVNFGKGWFPG